jgi:hypothetical protein
MKPERERERSRERIGVDEKDRIRYPSLNVYTSPRVFQQKIDHTSRPLCIYTGPVEANNVSKYHDQRIPDLSYLRKVDKADGLIYQFHQMKERFLINSQGQR